jgi:hypothetical protein
MDIKDFLSPAATLIGVRATDKVGLLQDLVNRLALPLNSPSNLVSAALLKREQLGSTGTGTIPHARISTLKKPLGILVRLNKPIEFDAIDGQPIDLVFRTPVAWRIQRRTYPRTRMRGPKAKGSGNSSQVEERGKRRRVLRCDRGITFANPLKRAVSTSGLADTPRSTANSKFHTLD